MEVTAVETPQWTTLDQRTKNEIIELAERLLALSPRRFREVLAGLRDVVEGQEIISRYDPLCCCWAPDEGPDSQV
jgi:hypothetical protein